MVVSRINLNSFGKDNRRTNCKRKLALDLHRVPIEGSFSLIELEGKVTILGNVTISGNFYFRKEVLYIRIVTPNDN